MRAAKATEWSFQGDVTFWFKDLCRQPDSVFKAFEQDERLPEGERPDGVLYGRVNDAFCEFELKRPNVPAEDMGLAIKAANKAMQLGAKYFVTWNVNELVLWTPDFGKRPWQWDRRKDKIASIYDLSQYHLLKPALEAAVKRLFQHLSALYVAAEPKKHFPPVPLDEKFIDFVQSHVDAFAFSFAEAIKAQEGNRAFMRRLREWFNEQQLPFVQDERRFIQAGRILAHLLINRVIFYEIVRQRHPMILPQLTIPDDLQGDAIRSLLQQRFEDVVDKINYEPVFEADFLDDIPFPETVTPYLQAFVDEVAHFDYEKIPAEIVGRVYERIIPPDERHLFGQYFTRTDVVDLITGFCVRKPDDAVLDASCGAGTFLVRARSRLRYLDPKRPHAQLLRQLYGTDIAKVPAHLASINLIAQDVQSPDNYPHVYHRDFFDCVPPTKGRMKGKQTEVPQVQTFIGNPPYTRQQELGDLTESQAAYRSKLLRTVEADFGDTVRIGGLPNIAVFFFLHGAAFLQEGGRLGLVTNNSWLDVDYGKYLQEFFLQQFRIIAIIEGKERWFPDAEVNTAITILEVEPNSAKREKHLVKFVSLRRPIVEILPPERDSQRWAHVDALVAKIERLRKDHVDATMRVVVKQQGELWEEGVDANERYVGSKWGQYLRAPDVFFKIAANPKMTPLARYATARLGITTGANEFFFIEEIDKGFYRSSVGKQEMTVNLPEDVVMPVLRSVSECDKYTFHVSDTDVRILMVDRDCKDASVRSYIRVGERFRLHERPFFGGRKHWYELGNCISDRIAVSEIIYARYGFVWNSDGCVLNKNFYGIETTMNKELLYGLLNFTFSYLFFEVNSRKLGAGASGISVKTANRLPILNSKCLTAKDREAVIEAGRSLRKRAILEIFDEITQPDRRKLDDVILKAMGFTDKAKREQVQAELYEAVCVLVQERLDKAGTVQSKASSANRANVQRIVQELLLSDFPAGVRKQFPQDFAPDGGKVIELPEGEVKLGTGIFDHTTITVGEETLNFDTPEQARFVALAALCGNRTVSLPDGQKTIEKTLADYRRYVKALEPKVTAAVQSATPGGRVRKAVEAELRRRLHLVEV